MLSDEEKTAMGRIALWVLAVFAGTVLLGVGTVVVLNVPGLLGAVVVSALVLSVLGVLLVLGLFWQTYALLRLRRDWEGFRSRREEESPPP